MALPRCWVLAVVSFLCAAVLFNIFLSLSSTSNDRLSYQNWDTKAIADVLLASANATLLSSSLQLPSTLAGVAGDLAPSTDIKPEQQQPKQPIRRNVTVVICEEDLSAEGMVYRSLIPYLFPSDQYHVNQIETQKAVLPENTSLTEVDVLLCLGYFYSQNYTLHRTQIGDKHGRLQLPVSNDYDSEGVFWPAKTDLVPHTPDRPFQFAFSTETWDRGTCRFDVIVTTIRNIQHEQCPIFFWPFMASSFFRRTEPRSRLVAKLTQPPSDAVARQILSNKTGFCAFAVSRCWSKMYKNHDHTLRVIFFDLLNEARQQQQQPNATADDATPKPDGVTAIGPCRRNTDNELVWKNNLSRLQDLDPVVQGFRPFKFAIVFENRAMLGYVTEKVLNAILADAIPIYWGAPDIGEYLNTDRLIHCQFESDKNKTAALQTFMAIPKPKDHREGEALIAKGRDLLRDVMAPCIQEVLRLDRDPEAYLRKLQQPVLAAKNGTATTTIEGTYFDLNRVAKSLRNVLKAYHSPLV